MNENTKRTQMRTWTKIKMQTSMKARIKENDEGIKLRIRTKTRIKKKRMQPR